MRTLSATILSVSIACGCGDYTPTKPTPTPVQDMAVAPQPTTNYCGGKGKHYLHLTDCKDHCVPDEQVFFLCTELRGKIAYTRQYLTIRQSFGYSLEYKSGSARCGDVAVSVWSLAPLTGLTNANTGKQSSSSVENDCSALPLGPPGIDKNQDHLYYVPVGPIADIIQ